MACTDGEEGGGQQHHRVEAGEKGGRKEVRLASPVQKEREREGGRRMESGIGQLTCSGGAVGSKLGLLRRVNA